MDLQLPASPEVPTPIHQSGESEDPRLCLLGGFHLACNNREIALPPVAQRLVAFLALRSRPVLRTYVASRLWPDSAEAQSGASLRSALFRIRRPAQAIVRATNTHIWLDDALRVDTRDVVATVNRLRRGAASDSKEDLDPLRLTGELLPDWTSGDWLLLERERFRQLCLHGLDALCVRLRDLGRGDEAIEAALAAVRMEPLRESAHRMVVALHLAQGNYSEAVRQYRWYERTIREELGLRPSPLMIQLFTRSPGLHAFITSRQEPTG